MLRTFDISTFSRSDTLTPPPTERVFQDKAEASLRMQQEINMRAESFILTQGGRDEIAVQRGRGSITPNRAIRPLRERLASAKPHAVEDATDGMET
jgi:hypothetical protein